MLMTCGALGFKVWLTVCLRGLIIRTGSDREKERERERVLSED
jgi:hypothetical protein